MWKTQDFSVDTTFVPILEPTKPIPYTVYVSVSIPRSTVAGAPKLTTHLQLTSKVGMYSVLPPLCHLSFYAFYLTEVPVSVVSYLFVQFL
jgi:hypothetical protein